jgi:membrane-associated phospholipid phosphatase
VYPEVSRNGWDLRDLGVVASLLALFALAQIGDHWIFVHFSYPAVYDRGWGRMLRVLGYAPTWAIAALGLVLRDRGRPPRTSLRKASRRGLLLFGCVCIAGLVAEGLKLVFRRERPGLTGGMHAFRAWSDQPFSTAQLGLPSSEGAVAFAAAAVLARLYPEGAILWWSLAIGCGLTRVAASAHFMSDIVFAALVGYAVTAGIWRRGGAPVAER